MKGLKAVLAVGVVLVSGEVQAASIEMGAWGIGKSSNSELLFASTADVRGNVLGQYCYSRSGNCVWGLAIKNRCEADKLAIVLASSNIEAVPVELRCDDSSRAPDGHYHYTFTNFGAIDDVVKRARRVEFSIPLERGGFSVVGFDLCRSNEAIATMHEVARGGEPAAAPAGVKALWDM